MEDLEKLSNKIIERLIEIRNKENTTLNEREEYKKLQNELRQVNNVIIWVKELKNDRV